VCRRIQAVFFSESLSNSDVQDSRLHALSHVRFPENGEVSDSDDDDDDDLPSFKKILARSTRMQLPTRPPVTDLACDSTDDGTEVSWYRNHPGAALSRKANSLPPTSYSELVDPRPPPTFLSHEPTHTTSGSSSPCPATASPGGKKSPFKNRPPWSPYLLKPYGSSIEPTSEPPGGAACPNTDNAGPISTVSESPPEHAEDLIGQPGDLPEIPEIPTVAISNVRSKEDDRSNDGSGLSFLLMLVD